MHRIAAALLERETIDAEELKLLLEGKALPALRSALAGVVTPMAANRSRFSNRKAAEPARAVCLKARRHRHKDSS